MPRKARPWWRSTPGEWYVWHNKKQTPLGVTDEKDQGAAWAAFKALIDKAAAEQAVVAAGRPEPVAALVNEYLNSIAHRVNPKTRHDYAAHLRKFISHFGNLCVGQIDPVTLEKCAAAQGWSDSHRANFLWVCQSLIRWAGRKDFALRRPAKESRGPDAMIPPEVYARLLRETSGDFHQFCRALWTTGARPSEMAGLAAETIDWTTGTAAIKKHKTKHKGKRRVVYLSTEAAAVLREQFDKYGGAGPLFRGLGGKPLTRHAVVCRFIRASERVGKKVRAYDFRHTFISRSLMRGVPAAMVAALVGTSVGMIDRFYGHLASCGDELRAAAERMVE